MPSQSEPNNVPIIYANAIGVSFTGAELFINLAVQISPEPPQNEMIPRGTIALSPGSAKFLQVVLERVISAHEKATGQIIPVDETRLKTINDAIAAGEKAAAARKASQEKS